MVLLFDFPVGLRLAYSVVGSGSGWRDLNPRPSGPQPDALPNCATSRNGPTLSRAVVEPVTGTYRMMMGCNLFLNTNCSFCDLL